MIEGPVALRRSQHPPSVATFQWQGPPRETLPRLKVRHMVDGLVPYKAYWYCVSAVGALGEGGKSNPMLVRAWAK